MLLLFLVCYIWFFMSGLSGRTDLSKEEMAQTCHFLKHLVTTDKRMDMVMLCPAGMKKTARAGCLMPVNMAVAAPVYLLEPKSHDISNEERERGRERETSLAYIDANTCNLNVSKISNARFSGTISVVPILYGTYLLCMPSVF